MDVPSDIERRISEIETDLANLDHHRNSLLIELASLRRKILQNSAPDQLSLHLQQTPINSQSPQVEKIRLFRSLFKGREDVFPRRFENIKTGKSGYAPAYRDNGIFGFQKSKDAPQKRDFIPLSDESIRYHLLGHDPQEHADKDFTIGVYPLITDETCWFLVADFDKSTWMEDARAFLETCASYQAPAVIERSRSGNGGHIWIFFESPVPAVSARKMGSFFLTIAMSRRPEIGMDSYDRLFPSQDTLPKGGFGNLIALPLQKKPRELNNSVFVDSDFVPYPDQWAFLSTIQKMSAQELDQILKTIQDESEVTGVRAVVLDENEEEPWKLSPSRKYKEATITGPLPDMINLVISNQIYVEKENLPAPLRNRIIRLAAFQNPEFYQAQAMHLSTYGKPRIISCCEVYPKHLALPRGCLDELIHLLEELNIKTSLKYEYAPGHPIEFAFQGTLRPSQQQAAERLAQYDIGVLSASTAFGKTVIGTWLIAQRKVNTRLLQ